MRCWSALLMLPLMLTGCGGGGGGGGGSSPPPAPSNQAPVITSPATASAAENSAGSIYQATATDANGDALTFSLAGGPDQSLFQITPAGALSFATPPDFEAPKDADANNVYVVRIGVSDGTTSATLDLSITVTNTGPDAFSLRRVGNGFASPLFLAPVPDGSGRVFVVEKGGRIRLLNPANGTVSGPFLDVSGIVSTDGERGLLGLATAPDFNASGTFYVYLTNLAGDIELRRYRTFTNDRDRADASTADIILTIPHPGASNHNGGWIAFGPDNFLYAAVGDGGGAGDPNNNAQNTQVLLAKMLRIDVSADAFPGDATRDYAIPAGNPFAGGGGRGEIWALGLRNPFRNSFDHESGRLYIADVGQDALEEVDLMTSGDGGANFGWALREGTEKFKGDAQASFVLPVAQYEHGSGAFEGQSITGGYVYRGPVEALRGQYFFADFVSRNIWSVAASSLVQGTTLSSASFTRRNPALVPNQGTIGNISSFGVDEAGNLYIVDFDGEIFRIEAS